MDVAVDARAGSLPTLQRELEVEPFLRRVPAEATCKGMFFNDILKSVNRASSQAGRRLASLRQRPRYVAFRDYPLKEHMELTAEAARLLFPALPSREGMRRLGWLAYPTFVNSMVGRVVFGVLGSDLDKVFEVGPRSFEVSLSHGRAYAQRMDERWWQYEFKDIFGYLDTYYVGVMEGPILHHRREPRVTLTLSSASDGVMDVRWR